MAMSVQIPSSPSDSASTLSSTHPPSPLTPPSISHSPSDVNADSNSAMIPPVGKRKPSRRANTAERRATHNAVERQRRETLNSRFLVSSWCQLRSHRNTHSIALGSRRSPAQPFPNSPPVQVFYRQLVHCPHPRFSPIQVDCCS